MNSIQKPQSWSPMRVQGPRIIQSDRFIPSRIATDLEAARLKLRNKTSEELSSSPSKVKYRKALSLCLFDTPDILSQNTRIFKLQSKVPQVQENVYAYLEDVHDVQEKIKVKPCKQRFISQSAERTLDAPNILDDYYLNLLDWSSTNKVSIALGQKMYIWDAATSAAVELFSVDDDVGPITSVSWTTNGGYLAAGMNNSEVQLWDHKRGKMMRTIRGNSCRVGSMAWNGNLLTTGNMEGLIVNHDVRIRDSAVQEYRGHTQEVCGLKWSPSGQFLASGGNDNLVHIWDRNMASVNLLGRNTAQYMHRLSDHMAAVKALAWCPFQNNLLATGGGSADRCIKFWNANNGACLNSVDTESQVCALLWNRHERELLSSHGYSQNQLTLWKYPSMTKITELTGHTSRVLHLAESPDGNTVASAAGDERLRFWQVFGNPGTKKPKQREPIPMSHYAHIR